MYLVCVFFIQPNACTYYTIFHVLLYCTSLLRDVAPRLCCKPPSVSTTGTTEPPTLLIVVVNAKDGEEVMHVHKAAPGDVVAGLTPTIMASDNTRQKKVFASTQGSGLSCSVPKPARTAKKLCFPHSALDCRLESLPHRARITSKHGGCMRPDPVLYQLFAIQNRNHFRSENKYTEMGQAPTSHGETSRYRPPPALKLGSEDYQLSGAYTLPVLSRYGPCEVITRGSGQVLYVCMCEQRVFSCAGSVRK